jgi:hypothetical protein
VYDAELIVTAVNTYDQILSILDDWKREISEGGDTLTTNIEAFDAILALLNYQSAETEVEVIEGTCVCGHVLTAGDRTLGNCGMCKRPLDGDRSPEGWEEG